MAVPCVQVCSPQSSGGGHLGRGSSSKAGTWRQELLKDAVCKSGWLNIKLSCAGLFPSTPTTSAAVGQNQLLTHSFFFLIPGQEFSE